MRQDIADRAGPELALAVPVAHALLEPFLVERRQALHPLALRVATSSSAHDVEVQLRPHRHLGRLVPDPREPEPLRRRRCAPSTTAPCAGAGPVRGARRAPPRWPRHRARTSGGTEPARSWRILPVGAVRRARRGRSAASRRGRAARTACRRSGGGTPPRPSPRSGARPTPASGRRGLQLGHGRGLGEALVPGTDVVADVAAERVALEPLGQLLGDRAPLLDGEIGDAAGGVEHVAARRTRRWGRRRGSGCSCRSDRR